MDLVLTLAGGWALALLLATGVASAWGALVSRRDLRAALAVSSRAPLELTAGVPVETGVSVRSRRIPLLAAATWRWESPVAEVALALPTARVSRERATPRARAFATSITRVLDTGDAFGLWRIRMRVVEDRAALVLPSIDRLVETDLTTCLAAGDLVEHPFGRPRGDRVDARPYNRSDPARFILWKVYARSRQLLVRAPEPARTPDARPLLFLATGDHDEAAAAVARLIWESGALGDRARFACDGAAEPITDRDLGLRALASSERFRDRRGGDLAAALAHGDIAPEDPVLVVAPVDDARTHARLLATIAAHPDRFTVLGAGDLVAPRRERGMRRAFLLPESAAPGTDIATATRALERFVPHGSRVVLADRASGTARVLSMGDGASDPSRISA